MHRRRLQCLALIVVYCPLMVVHSWFLIVIQSGFCWGNMAWPLHMPPKLAPNEWFQTLPMREQEASLLGFVTDSNSQCFKVLQSVILQLLPLFVRCCEVTVGLWKTLGLSWAQCESLAWFNDEFCFFKCEPGVFCGQVVIFVDADNAVRKAKGLLPHRFADLYHSANRTPVSTSEDWYHACSTYSWITVRRTVSSKSDGNNINLII